jgi:hypothetical protein
MIDPREKLKRELMILGVNDYNSTVISLDAGSSQCIVNKEYLNDIKIDKSILRPLHKNLNFQSKKVVYIFGCQVFNCYF